MTTLQNRSIAALAVAGLAFALSPVAAQTCKPESIPATTPTSRFTLHDNGTVSDPVTGLMWKRSAEGQSGTDCSGIRTNFAWQGALDRA